MDDTEKINRAIRACIRECFGSHAVLPRIAGFLDDLRATPGWEDPDVRLVERGVRRLLRGMVGDGETGGKVPNRRSA